MSKASLNWNGLDRRLEQAGKRLKNRQPLLRDVGEAMTTATIRRFQTETGPDGAPWTPSQRVRERGGKTLTDTAALRKSFGVAVTADAVFWGSNKVYARIHQQGGQAGRGLKTTLPARPFLGVNDGDQAEITEIIGDHLKKAFGK